MRVGLLVVVCTCLYAAIQAAAVADIFRWDNGQLIPGTEGITPQPGVLLDFHQLRFADLEDVGLHGSSFKYANLARADLSKSRLSGSDLTLATLTNARLVGTNLDFSVLNLADLSGANLSGASIVGSSLVRASLVDADLTGALFSGSNLTNVDMSGATITGTVFLDTIGFTSAQLYSTASFQSSELAGLVLSNPKDLDFAAQDLSGAQFLGDLNRIDFSGANLANAKFSPVATWNDVDITAADLRGADGNLQRGRNTILSMGQIEGLSLFANEVLVVRDYDGDPARQFGPMPILVQDEMAIGQGGRLRFEFEKDAWDSIISFEPSIPVSLDGTLELDFSEGINATLLRGRSIRVFDWSGVQPQGRFQIESPYLWDVTALYTTGEVRLTGAGLTADYNGNRMVDQVDLDLVLQNWGRESMVPPIRWVNDFPSGPIDQYELDKVLTNWGRTISRSSGVPEPSALALMVLGSAALLSLHLRRRLPR